MLIVFHIVNSPLFCSSLWLSFLSSTAASHTPAFPSQLNGASFSLFQPPTFAFYLLNFFPSLDDSSSMWANFSFFFQSPHRCLTSIYPFDSMVLCFSFPLVSYASFLFALVFPFVLLFLEAHFLSSHPLTTASLTSSTPLFSRISCPRRRFPFS